MYSLHAARGRHVVIMYVVANVCLLSYIKADKVAQIVKKKLALSR